MLELDAGFRYAPTLAAGFLALRRAESLQEIIEIGIAVVVPVELAVFATQEPVLVEQAPLLLDREQEVHRRRIELRGYCAGSVDQARGDRRSVRAGLHEQALAGGR